MAKTKKLRRKNGDGVTLLITLPATTMLALDLLVEKKQKDAVIPRQPNGLQLSMAREIAHKDGVEEANKYLADINKQLKVRRPTRTSVATEIIINKLQLVVS